MDSAIDRLAVNIHPDVEELKAIPIFSDLPAEGLEWLVAHMAVIEAEPGELVISSGAPAEYLFVILSGEMRAEREDGGMFIVRMGQVTGMLPFSRLTRITANVRAASRLRGAALHKDLFTEMLQRMPALQQRLVNVMADRIREATAADHQRQKLTALGKLSAGLAHELNNPASAAQRAAANLRNAIKSVRSAALKLDEDGLPAESRVFLAQLECRWSQEAGPQAALDSLDRSEREDEIAEWLKRHNIPQPWELAAALVDIGCSQATLIKVSENVPAQSLGNVLIKLTASFTISRLTDEIESSTERISELVRAVKEYSYMDQVAEQEIDIHQGLENTLIMLRHKLKKGIDVVREYDRTIAKVCARGSELNQIWTNLIVNAIDAMSGQGKLVIRTSRDGRYARVEVIDSGSGIPAEIQDRIFEPFFTTKAVGDGSGLGLDAVYRITKNHGGDITFDTRPGETRFIVRIPFDSKSQT